MGLTATVLAELDAARRRSLSLVEPLDEPALVSQHSPLMSPLVWDLAHIGNYEDQWLLRAVGAPGARPDLDGIYDAFRHPRPDRPSLPMLAPAETRAYLRDVRHRVLVAVEQARTDHGGDPWAPGGDGADSDRSLLDDAFVYGMVVQHEHQHVETMLATLQLAGLQPTGVLLAGLQPATVGPASTPPSGDVVVEAGTVVIGTSTDPWAYDNEGPAHTVEVAPFRIDRVPVTNRAYADFVDDGGYHERRWWDDAGWEHRRVEALEHPQFWQGDGGGWVRRRFGQVEALPADEPVQHVCWYEADAFARWSGRRLPTEAEWETAASWDPARGRKRRFPWGDVPPDGRLANLDGDHLGPATVGTRPDGASPNGCQQLIGDVWEWTSSDFVAHRGFRPFPYREYSEVFYGNGYKVLRGGSWATHRSAVRATFRNWDLPIRRQIFAGFRTASDA